MFWKLIIDFSLLFYLTVLFQCSNLCLLLGQLGVLYQWTQSTHTNTNSMPMFSFYLQKTTILLFLFTFRKWFCMFCTFVKYPFYRFHTSIYFHRIQLMRINSILSSFTIWKYSVLFELSRYVYLLSRQHPLHEHWHCSIMWRILGS